MDKTAARLISFIFHPLFLNYYLLVLVYAMNPFAFRIDQDRGVGVFHIMTFVIVVLFPLVAVLMLKGLNMIQSFSMNSKEERIGPLVVTLTCYIWFFINILNNSAYPRLLTAVALGAAAGLGMAFFINNFSKISLHCVGAGGFLCAVILLAFTLNIQEFKIVIPFLGIFRLSSIFVVFLATILSGAIGSARLILKTHRAEDIYGGYLVGAFAQLLAFGILIF